MLQKIKAVSKTAISNFLNLPTIAKLWWKAQNSYDKWSLFWFAFGIILLFTVNAVAGLLCLLVSNQFDIAGTNVRNLQVIDGKINYLANIQAQALAQVGDSDTAPEVEEGEAK